MFFISYLIMESPESFTLVNKLKNRIKVFKPFQSTLKQAQKMMEIEYGLFIKEVVNQL